MIGNETVRIKEGPAAGYGITATGSKKTRWWAIRRPGGELVGLHSVPTALPGKAQAIALRALVEAVARQRGSA